MASKKESADNSPTAEGFEVLYQRLEETVAKLEKGNLTLEESIALYEEGMALARRSQELLAEAELRISRLQESLPNGQAVGEDLGDYAPTASEADLLPE